MLTVLKMMLFVDLYFYVLRYSGQRATTPVSVPLWASFTLSGMNAQPLADSASAGGARFLDGWMAEICVAEKIPLFE